jgi:hypothetical protein
MCTAETVTSATRFQPVLRTVSGKTAGRGVRWRRRFPGREPQHRPMFALRHVGGHMGGPAIRQSSSWMPARAEPSCRTHIPVTSPSESVTFQTSQCASRQTSRKYGWPCSRNRDDRRYKNHAGALLRAGDHVPLGTEQSRLPGNSDVVSSICPGCRTMSSIQPPRSRTHASPLATVHRDVK